MTEKIKSKITPRNLWGIDLLEYLKTLSDEVDWIANGFITDASISMLYATDGIGKSLIGIQAGLELASGLPVFKGFHVDRPYKVIYCVAERSMKEPTKRIKQMISDEEFAGKILFENFTITTEFQGRDLSNIAQADALMEILKGHAAVMGGVDICFFDPLYALVRKDLKTDEAINGVFNFFRRVGNELGANVFFIHHENRGTKKEGEDKRTGQDFYGNKFISGLCTAVWHMVRDEDNSFTSIIANEKDSESCLVPKMVLDFNPEFNTVGVNLNTSIKAKEIMTDAFLKKMKEDNKHFSQEEFFTGTFIQMHKNSQRKFFMKLLEKGLVKNTAPSGYRGSYVAL